VRVVWRDHPFEDTMGVEGPSVQSAWWDPRPKERFRIPIAGVSRIGFKPLACASIS
jgi:hypothetical protein